MIGERHDESALPETRSRSSAPSMTRRALLAGTGHVALLAALPVACMPIVNAPWADGTFWDDGKGWSD